jgi:hypothetical protein
MDARLLDVLRATVPLCSEAGANRVELGRREGRRVELDVPERKVLGAVHLKPSVLRESSSLGGASTYL